MKNTKSFIISVLLLAALLGGATMLYKMLSKNVQPLQPITEQSDLQTREYTQQRAMAPDFTVEDHSGNDISLSDFKGKPVVINFWASWCGVCKNKLPDFQKAYARYGDKIEFMMINLTDGMRETKEAAKFEISEGDYSFPVYFDTQRNAAYAYYVSAIPATYFIDAGGRLVTSFRGGVDYDTLEKAIEMTIG